MTRSSVVADSAGSAAIRRRPYQPRPSDVIDVRDLEVTKSALRKGRARAFETSAAKLDYLASIADYGLPVDYFRSVNKSLSRR